MAKLFFFGDSITFGAWDSKGGWVDRLRETLAELTIQSNFSLYYEGYNLGIPGETTTTLKNRIANEIEARIAESDEKVIIFAIGINDTAFHIPTALTATSPHVFQENIKDLISKAHTYTNNILFVEMTPVDESRTYTIEWDPTLRYTNTEIEKYNTILHYVCSEISIACIPVYDHLIHTQNYESLFIDGLHPNEKGHEKLYTIVKEYLLMKGYIG